MSRIDEVPRTTQPQEDVRPGEEWINKGLIFAYSGASRRLVYGRQGLQAGASNASYTNNSIVPGVSEYGAGAVYNGSTSAQGWDTDSTITTNATARPWTLIVVARADSTASEIRAFGFGVPGGAASLFNIETSGTSWRFQARESTAAASTNLVGPSVTAKKTEVIVAKIAANRTMSLFMRGTKYSAAGPAGTISPYTVTLGCLYRVSDGAPIQLWNGWIGDAFIFDGELSDEDCQTLQSNPFQIWESERLYLPEFVPSGGGTQTRTVTPSGGLTLSGAAEQLRTRIVVPSGAVTFGGEATVSYVGLQTRVVTPSGGISLSGAAAKAAARNETPAGGITFGGAAAASFHESVRTVTPSGGITFSGAAYVYIPSVGAVATYQKFIYGRKGLATRKYR